MRILLVIPSITNFFTFLEELTESLQEKGHTVALASSEKHFSDVDCYAAEPDCEFFPIELPQAMNPLEHFRAAKKLRNIIDEFAPDIVHCHTAAGIFTTALVASSKSKKARFIATHHGMVYPLIHGWKRVLIGGAERWALRQLDSVHLLNKSDRDLLLEEGMSKGLFLYQTSMGIGCRIHQFSPEKVEESIKSELQTRFNLSDSNFLFIFVGRNVWFKGFDLTVRAFMRLHQENENCRLLVLGEPYKVHPTGLDDVERKRMDNHQAIHKVGWVKDVENYLSISHVNVFPSEREGMPVNLMESICMGVPVITRDTRGCNEIVEHKRSGFLIQNRDDDELLHRMRDCIERPELLKEMRQYCLRTRSRFDRQLWIDEQIGFYENLLSANNSWT